MKNVANAPSLDEIYAEFDRLNKKLSDLSLPDSQYECLYAIRQAMDWMLGRCQAMPYDDVMCGYIARRARGRRDKIREGEDLRA